MSDAVVESLILDLREWIGERERSYEEAMEAWRTSCPRLTVWEEANERGLVVCRQAGGRRTVEVTQGGWALLAERRGRLREDSRKA